MKECKGIKYTGQYQIPGSCNTDVWPSTPVDKAKPIKNQWNAYEKGKYTSTALRKGITLT